MKNKNTMRTCDKGHIFYKGSSCMVCPICANEEQHNNFLDKLSSPARRALLNSGIDNLAVLSKFSEQEILQLHGIGPTSIPILKKELEFQGLDFRTDEK